MNSEHEHENQVGARRRSSPFGRIERMPPLLVVLYLVILAITIMFVMLVTAYVTTRLRSGVPTGLHALPRYFSLSTIVLLLSSYTMAQAPRLYADDDLSSLARCLGATLLLGCVFAGLQVLGWRELMTTGVPFQGDASSSSGQFIYLISALHVAHLLGGMLFLLALLLRVVHADRDAVRTLVFIRNPYHRRQLGMLGTYWHFIDVLWVALFAVFLFLF
ncbi:cytochrome c oxidase subunit 3 [Hymenobacter sp. BT770]|uniref:cytochrome c oxidase subunit 3 n=1 Tax=Hymenobacter sp. BT770 TaxID=2886942 RepID=UPI001D12664D|nr:cytochrome c oxidase subunit 3 [Hymenobacter sp. BT770]MCC3152515.1 cytochrome c oxidase subunit 3 [Hymenobacter sp. BT770]MDO3414509.1 cytochrome c oxidase subunit 3 [Hymenobacter sp. BT770]